MKRRTVDILDVTIRDGSYSINYQYSPGEVAAIVENLDAAGIPYIEVGHGCGLGARENLGLPAKASDVEYTRAARQAAKHAKIGVIAGAAPLTLQKNIDAIIPYVDFIRFAANADDVSPPFSNLAYAKKQGVEIFFQMMRSSRRSKEELVIQAKRAEDAGVSTVYIVDTIGSFLPDTVAHITEAFKKKLAVNVGFHGHNNFGMALANSMAAIDAGADFIDGSLRGMGRGAGNAQLEILVTLMQRKKLATTIDIDILINAAATHIDPIMPPRRGIGGIDLLTAASNIDLYPEAFYERLAKELEIPLGDLIRYFASQAKMMEVGMPQIEKAIAHFGKNLETVLERLGIKTKK